MPNRTDLLNHLATKYDLKRYLEIGVQVPALNFDKIKCEYKVGVDPDPMAMTTYTMTSDQFFKTFAHQHVFDLIFIDGLHTAEQVRKDFENALKILSPKGFIVMHDCNPEKEEHTIVPRPTPTGHWNGSVYKFAAYLGYSHGCFYTVDIDNGLGVWKNGVEQYVPGEYIEECEWKWFNQWRKKCLNLISWDEFLNMPS